MAKKRVSKRKPRKRNKIKIRTIVIWTITALILLSGAYAVQMYLSYIHIGIGAKVPQGDYAYGIDISRYQPDVEWNELKLLIDDQGITTISQEKAEESKEISYVFIKATEGTSLKDKHFKKHWKKAKEAGVRRGAYHFFRSSKDAEKQANHFIKTVGKLTKDDLPPVLDIETIHDGCPHKVLNDRALTWLKTVEKHYGRKPIVYSNASFINDILGEEIKKNYHIWVAHYETPRPRCKRWHIWQFTDRGILPGIEGNVDMNVTSKEFLESI